MVLHPSFIEWFSTILFFIAIIHTFIINKIKIIANRFDSKTIIYSILHLLSEVELVFGIWSILFLLVFIFNNGFNSVLNYLMSLHFSEPLFVFIIMCISATRPIIFCAKKLIIKCAKISPFPRSISFYISTLIIGPLLGSFITEPAAMTVTAIILLNTLYNKDVSLKLKYATLSLLLVNISIGGTLTHFAAPPILMVATKWNWGLSFVFTHFGYKSLLAIGTSTLFYAFLFRKEFKKMDKQIVSHLILNEHIPKIFELIIHLLFLILTIIFSQNPAVFIFSFLCFCLMKRLINNREDRLRIKEAGLVGLFLAGLVCLGGMQAWWVGPLLNQMSNKVILLGAVSLTSITDNAALSYLGSLVDLKDSAKYFLIAGAVAGGGLTIIANAPNPAGFSILESSFGKEGIKAFSVFKWAIIPTIICILFFLILPSF